MAKKAKIEIRLKQADEAVLRATANDCGLTLSSFLSELAECRAAELRLSHMPAETTLVAAVN